MCELFCLHHQRCHRCHRCRRCHEHKTVGDGRFPRALYRCRDWRDAAGSSHVRQNGARSGRRVRRWYGMVWSGLVWYGLSSTQYWITRANTHSHTVVAQEPLSRLLVGGTVSGVSKREAKSHKPKPKPAGEHVTRLPPSIPDFNYS